VFGRIKRMTVKMELGTWNFGNREKRIVFI
jgi:hypothetical protein